MAGLQKILLVEDNPELRNLYQLFLTEYGYKIITAIDGEDGLLKAKETKPDLIFLDVMMPKLDGFQVLKKLRHEDEYGCTKTRIVLLTNLGDAGKVAADVKHDMDGYVVKAEIELSDLLEIIKSLEK